MRSKPADPVIVFANYSAVLPSHVPSLTPIRSDASMLVLVFPTRRAKFPYVLVKALLGR